MKTASTPAPHSGPLKSRLSQVLKAHAAGDEVEAAGKWADALLADAMDARASDIHLDPREDELTLRFRIDGVLQELDPLDLHAGERLIRYFKTNANFHDPRRDLSEYFTQS